MIRGSGGGRGMTMLIRVEHSTEYVYSKPLIASTQYLRLTPLSGRTQVVESWKVCCPGAVIHQWYDQYGNCCHTLTVAQPVTELAIRVSGLVRTRDTNGVVGIAPCRASARPLSARDVLYGVLGRPSAAMPPDSARSADRNRIEALHEIMLAIADDVAYTKGETHVHTTGAEALEQGSGVCQDHAHIFCAVCRSLGIPARYVSGYLSHGRGPCLEPRLGRRLCRASWLGELRSLQPYRCD